VSDAIAPLAIAIVDGEEADSGSCAGALARQERTRGMPPW
jgi:hypothetical protein